MNRNDLRQLQSLQDSPSVSILMPTHRSHPENRQDPIRLKNLIAEMTNHLTAEYDRHESAPILGQLDALVTQIDFRYTLDGLALFASQGFSRRFFLPFPVQERIVIGEKFSIRDLLFALNRSPRYWVLVLSEKPTRLYEGSREILTEVVAGDFPLAHLGPGGAESLPGGFGIKRSAIRDEYDRQFFRHVDEAFSSFATNDPVPVIVVGVKRNLAFFQEVTKHSQLVVGVVEGSHDRTSPSKIGELVWPLVQAWMANQRKEVFGEFEKAVGTGRSVSGVQAVQQAVEEGRGAVLLVEQGFHYVVGPDSIGTGLIPTDKHAKTDGSDDIVDELIDNTLSKGGKVVFMEAGMLADYQRIALILRF